MATGYVAVLRLAIDLGGAMQWQTLAERFFGEHCRTRSTAQEVLRELHALRLLHVSSWVTMRYECKRGSYSVLTPCYAFGSGADAPWPGYRTKPDKLRRQPKRPNPRSELVTLATAIEVLREDDHHGWSLAAEMGIGQQNAQRLLKVMHAHRLVHVSDYLRRNNGGVQCAMYSFGIDKPDKPRPKPMSRVDLQARRTREKTAQRRAARALGVLPAYPIKTLRLHSLGFTAAPKEAA